MHGRSWDQSTVLAGGCAAVCWTAGIVLFLGASNREEQHLGLLLVIVAALTTGLSVLRSWQLRMHRAFVHGFHIGRHESLGNDCLTEDPVDCEVLVLAEVQAKRLARLG